MNDNILNWLLSGDLSIQYFTHRDLLKSPTKIIKQAQEKIHLSGWCAKLLSYQNENGMFDGGLYIPKWTSTTYSLILLSHLGLKPKHSSALKSCKLLLDKGFYRDGGINFFGSLKCSEVCVTAMILKCLCYFELEDKRIVNLIHHLLSKQLRDGGWNCNYYKGEMHSSFHSTLSVLESLHESEKRFPQIFIELQKAQGKGIEFLLHHKLFRSHKTGKVVDPRMIRFSFPPRWRYDIMRCLDYFQSAQIKKDDRMNDAIEILMKKRNKDGTWNLQNKHPGKTFFEMEKAGKPSKWNTLRALRILNWWEK